LRAVNRESANATARPAAARSLEERRRALEAELSARGPAAARLAWLVERARARPPLPPAARTEAHQVPGCLSRLWLVSEVCDGRCRFACDSDSQVVRAVAGLLCELADDLPPGEILAAPPDLPVRLGLDRLLTASRRAAQARVWTLIRDFARAHADSG
jgi:cysteine desulfuration protein SufE